jgi:hypothetical protein
MVSGILNSDKAIAMNIAYHAGFCRDQRNIDPGNDLRVQLKAIKEKLGEHDAQLNQIYDAMENLLDEKAAGRNWDERGRIGFKINN